MSSICGLSSDSYCHRRSLVVLLCLADTTSTGIVERWIRRPLCFDVVNSHSRSSWKHLWQGGFSGKCIKLTVMKKWLIIKNIHITWPFFHIVFTLPRPTGKRGARSALLLLRHFSITNIDHRDKLIAAVQHASSKIPCTINRCGLRWIDRLLKSIPTEYKCDRLIRSVW